MTTRTCVNLILAALAVALVAAAARGAPDTMAQHPFGEVFKKVSPGVVRIVDGRRYASGLVIDPRGLIVTYRGIIKKNIMTVYFPDGPDSVTMVGYYDTVSAANTAAAAAVKDNGAYPSVQINYWHSDITAAPAGPDRHRDATADKPSWWDADPAY